MSKGFIGSNILRSVATLAVIGVVALPVMVFADEYDGFGGIFGGEAIGGGDIFGGGYDGSGDIFGGGYGGYGDVFGGGYDGLGGAYVSAPEIYGASVAAPEIYGASVAAPEVYGASVGAPEYYGSSYSTPQTYSFSSPQYSSPSYSAPRTMTTGGGYSVSQPRVATVSQPRTIATPTYTSGSYSTGVSYGGGTMYGGSAPVYPATPQYPVVYQQPQQPAPSCQIRMQQGQYYVNNANPPATLTWSSSYATSATITQLGTVAVNGSRTVYPSSGMIYTMTVQGPGGISTCQTTAAYIPTPPIQVPAMSTATKGTDSVRDATRYASDEPDLRVTRAPVIQRIAI